MQAKGWYRQAGVVVWLLLYLCLSRSCAVLNQEIAFRLLGCHVENK